MNAVERLVSYYVISFTNTDTEIPIETTSSEITSIRWACGGSRGARGAVRAPPQDSWGP